MLPPVKGIKKNEDNISPSFINVIYISHDELKRIYIFSSVIMRKTIVVPKDPPVLPNKSLYTAVVNRVWLNDAARFSKMSSEDFAK